MINTKSHNFTKDIMVFWYPGMDVETISFNLLIPMIRSPGNPHVPIFLISFSYISITCIQSSYV